MKEVLYPMFGVPDYIWAISKTVLTILVLPKYHFNLMFVQCDTYLTDCIHQAQIGYSCESVIFCLCGMSWCSSASSSCCKRL